MRLRRRRGQRSDRQGPHRRDRSSSTVSWTRPCFGCTPRSASSSSSTPSTGGTSPWTPHAINHTGIGSLEARADWADLAAFDETVSAVAEAIKDLPEFEHESLDVTPRRIALGILADPARALALLAR